MANNAIFTNIATLLWAVNISAPRDEKGKPILPDTTKSNLGLAV